MDAADRAQMLEEAERECAIAAALAHPREADAHLPWWLHITHCVECGGEIPPARRHAVPGARRCVLCQYDHDRRTAHYGG